MAKFMKISENKYVLDVRGYVCPYPVIYSRKILSKLKSGEILEILTDNPPSCENVPKAVIEDGHEVESVSRVEEGVWKITVIKR